MYITTKPGIESCLTSQGAPPEIAVILQELGAVVEILKCYGLYTTCTEPTRGLACLDNVAVSLQPENCSTNVIELHGDDHSALRTSCIIPAAIELCATPSSTWHADYIFRARPVHESALEGFKDLLASVSWNDVFLSSGRTGLFAAFFDFFRDKFNFFFPEIVKPRRPHALKRRPRHLDGHKEWYTDDLARLRGILLALKNRCEDGDADTSARYRKFKQFYKRRIELAKRLATERRIEDAPNQCKAAWDVINTNRSMPRKSIGFASPDDFNGFFVGSVQDIVGDLPDVAIDPIALLEGRVQPSQKHLSFFRPTTPAALRKIIHSFKPSKSPDVFGMSVSMLRDVVDAVAVPLCASVNECLRSGKFPDFLKTSRTVPVFKKGDRECLHSFRPISITPVFGKVIEAVIKPQLEAFFEENGLFSDMQFGFRVGRSTVGAVDHVAERIDTAFEDGESLALALCDLSRAFDCVDHGILLRKLSFYGLRDSALSILGSYLSGRTQLVSLSGADSRTLPVAFGVPQGSVLGPTLFLVMINDLDDHGSSLMFADDASLLSSGAELERVLEASAEHLRSATSWFLIPDSKSIPAE
ncbi:uncharacterized protein LOC120353585 [Nilaparvata lugens]|uniref:uncharacterized protein LOC120353585 n=1 Tax=Nilaparvata lugens TaxID=108931 RepID=UPI00193D723F|nr:uncharacterized protein LOC120353585 [Nilaparvata lugens]